MSGIIAVTSQGTKLFQLPWTKKGEDGKVAPSSSSPSSPSSSSQAQQLRQIEEVSCLCDYPATQVTFSGDEKLMAFQSSSTSVRVMKVDNGKIGEAVGELEVPDLLLHGVTLSPTGKFVCTWQKHKQGGEPNVRLMRNDGTLVKDWSMPWLDSRQWPAIRFTLEEDLVLVLNGPFLEVLDARDGAQLGRFRVCADKRIATFAVLTDRGNDLLLPMAIQPARGAEPTLNFFALTTAPKVSIKLIREQRLPKCDWIELKEHKMKYLMFKLVIEQDRIHGTYGGTSSLSIVYPFSRKIEQLMTSNDYGPILDVAFHPTQPLVATIAGYMEKLPQAKLWDLEKGTEVASFKITGKYNTLCFSPTGQFLAISGFGALQGISEIFELSGPLGTTIKMVGTFKSFGTSYIKFSPDSSVLATATITPRLRVDNRFAILRPNGDTVTPAKDFATLFNVYWLPMPGVKFAPVVPPPFHPLPAVEVARYVPPHLRGRNGASSAPGTQSQASAGRPGANGGRRLPLGCEPPSDD